MKNSYMQVFVFFNPSFKHYLLYCTTNLSEIRFFCQIQASHLNEHQELSTKNAKVIAKTNHNDF